MAFFTFSQNNPGGHTEYDDEKGISRYVIVEAANAKYANRYLKNLVGESSWEDECRCCGARWYTTSDRQGTEHPEVFGTRPNPIWLSLRPQGGFYELAVHYQDGSVEMYGGV